MMYSLGSTMRVASRLTGRERGRYLFPLHACILSLLYLVMMGYIVDYLGDYPRYARQSLSSCYLSDYLSVYLDAGMMCILGRHDGVHDREPDVVMMGYLDVIPRQA